MKESSNKNKKKTKITWQKNNERWK